MHIPISLGNKFHFKQTVLSFGIKLPKKHICGQKRKSEHHHRIVDIGISLCTKF